MVAALAPMPLSARPTSRVKFIGERYLRVWQMVEMIAHEPGLTRIDLADRFGFSQRQIQGDLIIIRDDLRLPLVRRHGYRFIAEGGLEATRNGLTLAEALLLARVLRLANDSQSAGRVALQMLAARLPSMAPPHLQPLIARLMDAAGGVKTPKRTVFALLADALLDGTWVKVIFRTDDPSWPSVIGNTPTIKPLVLLPVRDRWFVVAEIPRRRVRTMFCIDSVLDAVVAEAPQ